MSPDALDLLICECGVVSKGYAGARCGRDRTKNVRIGCPVRLAHYVLELGGYEGEIRVRRGAGGEWIAHHSNPVHGSVSGSREIALQAVAGWTL